MNVLAATARRPGAPLSLDLAAPCPDEVVVRVVATGICRTAPAMRDQTFPVPQPVDPLCFH